MIVKEINQQWDVDLMDMARIASDNDGVHFVLLCIDIFSRYVWTYPLKNKSGEEVSIPLFLSFKTAYQNVSVLIKAQSL